MLIPIIVATVLVILMLGVGGISTTVGPWYRGLRKPSWNPPAWVFGPAWTIILGLAGWAGVLGWIHTGDGGTLTAIMILFGINIALHMLWSPLFFALRRPDWALIEIPFLWLSIAGLMVMLAPVSALAAWLLLPYLLWVGFAIALNATIIRMNGPFNGSAMRAD